VPSFRDVGSPGPGTFCPLNGRESAALGRPAFSHGDLKQDRRNCALAWSVMDDGSARGKVN